MSRPETKKPKFFLEKGSQKISESHLKGVSPTPSTIVPAKPRRVPAPDCFTVNICHKRITFLIGPQAHQKFFKPTDQPPARRLGPAAPSPPLLLSPRVDSF